MTGYTQIGLIFGLFFLGIIGGWHGHTIYDGYKNAEIAAAEVKRAQEGQSNIIKFNQTFTKAVTHDKDKCINTVMPADIRRLLK